MVMIEVLNVILELFNGTGSATEFLAEIPVKSIKVEYPWELF